MTFFSKQEVLELHHANIERFGGSHGLRDEGVHDRSSVSDLFGFQSTGASRCFLADPTVGDSLLCVLDFAALSVIAILPGLDARSLLEQGHSGPS